MKRGRNQTAVALVATLGLGVLAAACGTEPGESSQDTAAARAGSSIDSFNETDTSAWGLFADETSSIATARAADHTGGTGASLQVTYRVGFGGYAGLERLFSSPRNWSNVSAINLWVNGQGTGHTFLVQVYDAGNERWESRFTVDFNGWRQITLRFSQMTAASWQPPEATADGVQDFTAVNGIALIPSEGQGSGSVGIDALALGAASGTTTTATGGASGTSTGGTTVTPTSTGGTPVTTTTTSTGGTTGTGAGGMAATTTSTGGTTPTPTSTGGTTPATTTSTGGTTSTTTTTTTTTVAGLVGATGVNGTIIPLYTAPTDPSWAAVAAAKQAHPSVPVIAIVNPSNGPGAAQDASYASGITKLAVAGVKVIGYVHTSWGARATSQLQSEMDQWHNWYPSVSGVFFDEMSNTAGQESYYRTLGAYAKSHVGGFTVGNPGSDSAASYVGTLDVLLIYESNGLPTMSAITGWHTSYARTNFGVIPYKVSSMDAAFVAAARPYVGYIYLQSDDLPNPWDSVPTYLDSLVGSLQ